MALLLILLLGQLLLGSWADGVTYDEPDYIARGYRHLVLGDQRIGAEHPPLANVLAALPLTLLPVQVRPLQPDELTRWWDSSLEFLFVDNAHLPLVRWARVGTVAVTVLLAVLVWAWCRTLFGPTAAAVALALYAFHPSLLAHGHLATTDLPGTATTIFASWALWRWSRQPSWRRAAVFGLAFGLAAATRLSVFVLVPILALLAVLPLDPARRPRAAALGTLAAWWVGSAWLVVWGAYGFRFRPGPGDSEGPIVPTAWLQALDGTAGRLLRDLRHSRLLPGGYVTALEVHLMKTALGNEGYLLGERGTSGWRHYYVVALLAKSTPGFLLLAGLALAPVVRARGSPARPLAHFWLPAAAFFLAASLSKVQVGERYVLPVHVYLIVLVAGATPWLLARSGGRVALAAGLAVHLFSGLTAARRGYLAYFSPLAGGFDTAHLVLVDSNLDWGQDLPRLESWMERKGVARVQLGYFGRDDPARYGIAYEALPGSRRGTSPARFEGLRGVVVVSPTLLVGLYAGRDFYAPLRRRPPDDRAGALLIFINRLPDTGP